MTLGNSHCLRTLSLILAGTALASCAGSTPDPTQPPPPTPEPVASLPTAVPPENPAGNWAIAFRHSFPAGFWSEGQHRYGYFIECPMLDSVSGAGEWRFFTVSQDAPTFESPIYLRLGGLSTGTLAPINMESIHPDQATVAVVTILGLSEVTASDAATSDDCQVVIGWDNGFGAETLLPGEPFQP